jgi:hypothetical protein
MTVPGEALSDLLGIRLGDLAAEEIDREPRHDGGMLADFVR